MPFRQFLGKILSPHAHVVLAQSSIFIVSTALTFLVVQTPSRSQDHAAASPQYTVMDLGFLPDSDMTTATGLNNKGQIVGYCFRYVSPGHGNSKRAHSFVWEGGKITPLPTLGGEYSHAQAINDAGDIVGDAETPDSNTVPVLWPHDRRDKPVRLVPENGSAYLITSDATIVLETDSVGYRGNKCVVWRQGKIQTLSFPPNVGWGQVGGINKHKEIVGYTGAIRSDGIWEPYEFGLVWRKGKPALLPTLGGEYSGALSIGENGTIVGWAETRQQESHACCWEKGIPRDLGTLGGKRDSALSINASGQIVGAAQTPHRYAACLWDKGAAYDLNTRLASTASWELYTAISINNKGAIIADGAKQNQVDIAPRHALLLLPTP